MISVLILTKNEELALPRCLGSLGWCDDVHVFDSMSADRTCEIARSAGASVTQRAFDDYATQRNAALHTLKYRYSWVLSLDADEFAPSKLGDELRRFVISAPPTVVAGRIRRQDYFQGRWLRHAQISPFYVRLVRPDKVRYVRAVNEILVPDGDIGELNEPFYHFPFVSGVERWVARHNAYSTIEAKQPGNDGLGWGELLKMATREPDFNQRRKYQKAIFMRLPGRPWLKFLYMMVVRRAFLDGRQGIEYALLQCFYEYIICLKERELKCGGFDRRVDSNERR